MSRRSRTLSIGIVVLLGVALAVSLASTVRELHVPVALGSVAYVQSATCVRCHPGHFESWHRTYHRTMTQEATPSSVLGDFGYASYGYEGVTSRFTRSGDGFYMETLDDRGRMRRYEIARTVGSRRIQQYVAREGDHYVRLPLAWNIEERRWFHLNGGFLDPDGTDFNAHRTTWDANCIFCHNTKAAPGYDWNAKTFDSRVAELGIACEACHGPAAEHIERNTNPLRRYVLYETDDRDPTIVNPRALPKEEQVQICGHCHGQRVPNPIDRIRTFLSQGDPYTAGDDLRDYTSPIWRDSKLEGVDLSLRFWGDGTPRLTAYEYQGLLMTADYQKGGLTCIMCHSAHGGDPNGMITDEMRGPAACVRCHADLCADIPAHTKHEAASSGSDCYACHMPKIAYGVLGVHPTHRIESPDPSRAWRYEMPEACTLCHANRTARWAAEATSRLYGSELPRDMPTGPEFGVAEDVRALLGGDVVQRAVAAMALGDPVSYTCDPRTRLWAVPLLVIAMEDRYPAVRHFAYRSARALVDGASRVDPDLARSAASLPDFDPEADAATRAAVVAAWRSWWAALDKRAIPHPGASVPLDAALEPVGATIGALARRQRDQQPISIGE
jgi:predicted CXXCH cytochrome family protein